MNGGRGSSRVVSIVLPVACAVGLALVACTGAPTTAPSPSVSTSSRPTTTPSPTPTPTPDAAVKPERPAAMDEVNAAGAEAAAVYFLELYPYVYATGDLTEWRELSHPECVFCSSVISNVEEQVAAGNRSEGGRIVIESTETTDVSNDLFSVAVLATQGAGFEYGPDGQLVEESAASHSEVHLVVVRVGPRWNVRAVQVDEAPRA